jgi:hypothetical protein
MELDGASFDVAIDKATMDAMMTQIRDVWVSGDETQLGRDCSHWQS